VILICSGNNDIIKIIAKTALEKCENDDSKYYCNGAQQIFFAVQKRGEDNKIIDIKDGNINNPVVNEDHYS
jgi:hypothetical protein